VRGGHVIIGCLHLLWCWSENRTTVSKPRFFPRKQTKTDRPQPVWNRNSTRRSGRLRNMYCNRGARQRLQWVQLRSHWYAMLLSCLLACSTNRV